MSKVTIVIPTHNRHRYLVRSVSWFLQGGYDVVIADSTESPWAHSLQSDPRVTYIHRPGSYAVYVDKVLAALMAVKTPMVAMCADDDFILFSGLEAGADFLDNNEDYAFCQGYAYLFQTIAGHHAIWPMPYDFHDVESPDWLERVVATKSTVYYGLNRTAALLEAFRFLHEARLSRSTKAGGLVDFALTSIVARAGKMKRLRIPFSLREYSPSVNVVGTRPELLLDPDTVVFFQTLLQRLMKEEAGQQCEAEHALIQAFAEDFSGQLRYDLTPSASRRGIVQSLPKALQEAAELGVRWKAAMHGFMRKGYGPAVSLFASREYSMFKKQLQDYPV